MIIYQESKAGFIRDVDHNALEPRLKEAFKEKTGGIPADSRVWADEYTRFSTCLRNAAVEDEVQVAIEYHISAAGRFRIDVLLGGSDGTNDNGVILELKAWDTAEFSRIAELVYAPYKGGVDSQHPCVQARNYKRLIYAFNQDVRERGINLHSAAYLFNLHRRKFEPLEDARYSEILSDTRLFLADDAEILKGYLEQLVPKKPKQDVVFYIDNGRLKPSEELVTRVSSMLEGNEEFILVDGQNEAFQILRHGILETQKADERHVFVVKGGPGTGKSVIAVRLMAEVLKSKRAGFFVAPNKAFRDTLIEYLTKGNRGYRSDGQALFQSSWSFHKADYAKDKQYDVLVVDEAHRLKGKGAYQYAGQSMVEDMVRAARVSVFFIDEGQVVSWKDIGSVEAIRQAAKKYGANFHEPRELVAQFRCNGSEGYLNWLDDVLQIKETANYNGWGGDYEFRVFERAEDLYEALRAKNGNNKARLIAGYSWPWPTKGRERGSGVKHVRAAGLSLPWNYSGENWATSRDGIEQVGCIHTSQGLEFDWLGVLIGPDLIYRDGKVIGVPAERAKTDVSLKGWKGDFAACKDDGERGRVLERVQEIIKGTYKVLLSRGRMGCFVWCADGELGRYLNGRLGG